jgi:P27 family predicted phage terminase small subunit
MGMKNTEMTPQERAEKYIKAVRKYLTDKFEKIEPSWEGQLNILYEMYLTFLQAKDVIKRDGVCVLDRYGVLKKNPAFDICKDCSNQITKIVGNFALSPFAKSKIKELEDEDSSDIIKGLLSD